MRQPRIFLAFLWQGHGWPQEKVVPTYTARHVNILASMLQRHGGHQLCCVTDCPSGIAESVRIIALPPEVAALPRYYPKVWAFSDELAAAIGTRFSVLDLDAVIVGDLGTLADRPDDFIIWNQARGEFYNTSFFTINPGARSWVWRQFTVDAAEKAKDEAEQAGRRWTGDQSWVGHILGGGEPTYSEADGLLQYRQLRDRHASFPEALAYFLCGPYDPASEVVLSPWMREAWQ